MDADFSTQALQYQTTILRNTRLGQDASLLPWAACASVTDSFLSRSDPINAFNVAEPATIP